jgi:hypothetical protein
LSVARRERLKILLQSLVCLLRSCQISRLQRLTKLAEFLADAVFGLALPAVMMVCVCGLRLDVLLNLRKILLSG